jgi:transcriptional regulator with XRE-family HTH domain
MGKQYGSVLDMVKDTSDSKELVKSLEQTINTRRIAKTLISLRCRAGLNQEEVAKKMKCSQGKISKIENAADADLTIGDVTGYCSAVNMTLEIGFSDRNMKMVDRVKYHYFKIKAILDKMLEMSKGDKQMEVGVHNFTKEVFVNATFGLLDCMKRSIPEKQEAHQMLHVSNPVIADEMPTMHDTEKEAVCV